MNFSKISQKTLAGKLLRLPLRLLPKRMQMPIWQGALRGKKWIVGSGLHRCWLGSYEYEQRCLFEKTVTRGGVVFDIGAHVGFYTLLSSVLVGPEGRVFAFEPLPSNLAYLKEHLRLNKVSNVTVIEAVVLDRTGAALFKEGWNSAAGQVSPDGTLQVPSVQLDDQVARGQLPAPSCMKIDVEGAEELVLVGARSVLAEAHPTVFLSIHGPEAHQGCFRALQALGYELQPITGPTSEQEEQVLAVYKR